MQHPEDKTGSSGDIIQPCEAWLNAVILMSPIPQFVIDGNHRIVQWNKALEKYSGIKAEEVIGTNQQWRAFYHDERPCLADLLVDGLEERIPEWYSGKYSESALINGAYEATDFFPKMKESGTWLYFTAVAIRDAEGRIAGAVETLEDITKRKKAEEALKESEERYRSFVEKFKGIAYLANTDWTPIFFHGAVEQITGYNEDDLIAGNPRWDQMILPDDLAEIVARDNEKLLSIPGYFVQREYRIIRKDGEVRWLSDFIQNQFGKNGEILLSGILTDITYRKNAEESLRKSEDKFRSVFDWANDAILLHILTTEKTPGRFIELNRVACRMLGYSREELLKMGPMDIVPSELHPQLKEIIRQAKTKKNFIFETRFMRKDQTTFPVESSCHLVDYDGEKIWISHIRDITERKESEEELRKSEEQYRNLVENISDVIFTMDIGGKITYISPIVEKIYGYTPDEVTGVQFSRFVHPDDLPRILESFHQRTRGEYGDNVFRIIDKDGSEHYVRTTMTPVIREGKVKGFNYVMADFTERQNAEEALRQANKKLKMLSSITRHDILNQIMGIKGHLELSTGITKDPKLQEYIGIESEAIDKIQRQIEFTRYYQDIGIEEPKWEDVGNIFREAAEQLNLRDITLDNSVSGLEIFTDPLIEKVFYNLIENSLRHGKHVTSIGISYSETDDGLVISYRDNGVGISREEKKELFRKGFGEHTGLGLFLSKEILSITGISIRETGKPGKGVNFEITVPKGDYRFTD